MKNLNQALFRILFVVVILIGAFGIIYGMSWFNQTAIPIKVHLVEPGVKCAAMVTSNNVAIDCWKVEK